MSIGRPDVVEGLLGKSPDYFSLDGPEMHARISGTADIVTDDITSAMAWVRRYLGNFPLQAGEPLHIHPAVLPGADKISISSLLPDSPDQPFPIRPLLDALLDEGSLLEIKQEYSKEVITALASIEGHGFGLISSNSMHHSGILFPNTCDKIRRFISLCEAFSLPLVFLADIPGFMIGSAAEQAGSIRHGAALFKTIARSTRSLSENRHFVQNRRIFKK